VDVGEASIDTTADQVCPVVENRLYIVRRTAKDVNRKRRGIMIWVVRALAAVAVMMLIYALILRFWPH
jgi:hypothetical protein